MQWCNKVQLAFSKQHYLHMKIVTRARSLGLAITNLPHKKYMAAAQLLDVERGGRTMTQYLHYLKSLYSVVHCCNFMERDDDGGGYGAHG
eukprot:14294430-Ditylum_brightwellii.AAC.1